MSNAIDSKTKRDKLAPRREPYWAPIKKGWFVGFRKLESGEGSWIARWRGEDGKQKYRALGNFPSFDKAADAARSWMANCDQGVNPKTATVDEACKAYVLALEQEGRKETAKDAKGRFGRLVYDQQFGKIELDRLRTTHVHRWLVDQIDQDDEADDEDIRRSKDSANRNLATLKAALNRAVQNRLVATDSGWRTVKAFTKVGARRKDAFLSMESRKALLAKLPDDLQTLATAMLLTGARPGELATLNASDFDKRLGVLTLRGKTGSRTVAISTAAAKFFADLVKEKIANAPMLATAFGQRWDKDAWKKPFKAAADAAGLPVSVVMYSLRHTAISEMILAGMDSFIVAKLTGTSVAMIESSYGHLKHSIVTAKLDAVTML